MINNTTCNLNARLGMLGPTIVVLASACMCRQFFNDFWYQTSIRSFVWLYACMSVSKLCHEEFFLQKLHTVLSGQNKSTVAHAMPFIFLPFICCQHFWNEYD
jgi:hypothetical protein